MRIGFTLIELLIVVAIIGILAAISIPNFLEAQVRAKVAKVLADMRTYGTAQEMYAADNNNYPPMIYQEPASQYGRPSYSNDPALSLNVWTWIKFKKTGIEGGAARHLTTPIAYLNLSPAGLEDIFHGSLDYADLDLMGFEYNYWHLGMGIAKGRVLLPFEVWGFADNIQWMLGSVGPDARRENGYFYGGTQVIAYDPTNGTVSRGDIYFMQGVGPIPHR